MAKTIDDYDNFINLLSKPENFRVYSIDDNIKTTNISIKLIAIICENESNNYELKFINKKSENPIDLMKYAKENPIYYNSNNMKCITSMHANDYEKNIYNIYHNPVTKLGEYIKYYIINNQDIIYEIKIYVPLIIIMNKDKKIVLIDRTSKNFSETKEECSIKIDLLKRLSKKLFNIIDKYLKDTKFEGEFIKNIEEFNKITQLPLQSKESASKVPTVPTLPTVSQSEKKKTQDGLTQQEVKDDTPQTSSKKQQVEPSAPLSGLPSAPLSGLSSVPLSGLPSVPLSGLPSAPLVPPVASQAKHVIQEPQVRPEVLVTMPVQDAKNYIEYCAIDILKNINITKESVIKENDVDFYKNGIVIVAPIDKYNTSLIKEIYEKFKLTFNEQEITNNHKDCDAMFKKYDNINIINLINPNLEPFKDINSSNIEENLKKLQTLINTSYINILKELIKNINQNNNIQELRIPINYNKKSAGYFYDNITIPTYSFYALYEALNSLTRNEINLLTRYKNIKISIHISTDEKDYNYEEVIKNLEDLKTRHINNYKDQCDLKQKQLREKRRYEQEQMNKQQI